MKSIVRVVENDSLRVTAGGYRLGLRLMWYRSLPLSCIENIRLSLDGQPVDPGLLRLEVNGHSYRLEQLADRVEEFWYILDTAFLDVEQPGVVTRGENHRIEAEVTVHYPYIPIGPGMFLTSTNRYSDTQLAG